MKMQCHTPPPQFHCSFAGTNLFSAIEWNCSSLSPGLSLGKSMCLNPCAKKKRIAVMYRRMYNAKCTAMSTGSRSADEDPLLVVTLGAHLGKVRAKSVLDHIVRDLGESAILVSICSWN